MHFIGGNWLEGKGTAFHSLNPSTGEVIWQGASATEAEVNQAVSAARGALGAWSPLALEERIAKLESFSALLESKKEELARLIARENGKVVWDAAGEVAAAAGKLKFALKAYAERCAERRKEMEGFRATLIHRPHGVMAVFGPYNFPAHLPNGHIIPALLAGNTIVFKPSEQTPAVGEWMAQCWEAAELPAGVMNLVQGEKETGIALAASEINGLLFTGSSATGKLLHRQCAGRPEMLLALELGGNNPLVVDRISDAHAAAYETVQSAYLSSGQRCTCARRLIVTEGAHRTPFLEALEKMIRALKVGPAEAEPAPFMGPLISNAEADRLLGAQETLRKRGGKSLVTMERLDPALPFLSPGLIDVTHVADRPDEEWFGPLLQLIQVPDLNAAIAEANNTAYGLSAALFSDVEDDFLRFRTAVRAGIINWNKQTTGASGMAPFGGVGCSGNHHPAGYYAADYCAYPVAGMEADGLPVPERYLPGIAP